MSALSSVRLIRLGAALLALAAFGSVFASAAPAATGDNYVALGDSYSSGVGTGSYTLDAACKRSVYAYPYLYTQQHPGTTLSFVACSGAKTSDLLSKQVQALSGTTTIVTMTIGGNDIGFANLIYQCTVADCSATLDSTRVNLENTLAPALNQVYSTVKSDAPNAKIIVLGYPRVFSGSSCLGTLGITPTEQMKANALADELNRVIAKYASSNQVTYESAIGPFLGHAVCSFSPYLNGLNLFNTGESYHPTRSGQSSGYLPLVTAGLTG